MRALNPAPTFVCDPTSLHTSEIMTSHLNYYSSVGYTEQHSQRHQHITYNRRYHYIILGHCLAKICDMDLNHFVCFPSVKVKSQLMDEE